MVAFSVVGGEARGGDVKPACKNWVVKELGTFFRKLDKNGLSDIFSGGRIVFKPTGRCGIDERKAAVDEFSESPLIAFANIFTEKDGVRFFALDSNYVDKTQLEWLDKQLAASGSEWKIMFFHHPLYSSGETHGSAELQRGLLEPLFVKHGVNLVLTGHEHFYERLKPQKGIQYFIIGNSAKLRKGDLSKSDLTLFGTDREYAFMLMEIDGDELFFQTINEKGQTIDTGSVRRVGKVEPAPGRTTQPVIPQAKPTPAQPGPRQPADKSTPSSDSKSTPSK